MGQIFHAVIYDTNKMECNVDDVDKFHANCYDFCVNVKEVHYFLRKAPYRIMWLGGYVVLDDNIADFLTKERLLGISTNLTTEDFIRNNKNESLEKYQELQELDKLHDSWKPLKTLNYDQYPEVKYTGYLVNHSQKQAVDLKRYYELSVSSNSRKEHFAIDAIPFLTETGGGTIMAVFDGCSAESTENLIGSWCGDLLQIVDELPEDYQVIHCCMAEIWGRVKYCHQTFGLDSENFILKNDQKDRFRCISLSPRLFRTKEAYIREEKQEDGMYYCSAPID